MVMNITLDDNAGLLSYSPGWRIQPRSDPNFFQGGYHASQSANETVSVTFNCTAIYIYGSKGTTYGDFKVQLDDAVTFNSSSLPASSRPNVEYQQLLYANTFSDGSHFVALSTTTNMWVDVDYIVLTVAGPDAGTSDPGSFTSTVSALEPSGTSSDTVFLSSSQTITSSISRRPHIETSSSPPVSSDSHTTTPNITTAALAGVFGGLLFLALLFLLVYRILNRYRRRQYEREREFRTGAHPYSRTTRETRHGGGIFSVLPSGSGSLSSGGHSALPSSVSPGIPRPSHAGGVSPFNTASAFAITREGPMPRNQTLDPRQSIDFLSVRS